MIENRIREVGHNILAPLVHLTGAAFLNNVCVSMNVDINSLPVLQSALNAKCSMLQQNDTN